MKKLLTLIVIFCIAAVADEPVAALKLLSIGNSFSVNAHRHLGAARRQELRLRRYPRCPVREHPPGDGPAVREDLPCGVCKEL